MTNPNPERSPLQPELITAIPAAIRNAAIGARASTGPEFGFPLAGTQEYDHARYIDSNGNITGIEVLEHQGGGRTTRRRLTGEELAAFLAANPDVV